MAAGLQPEAEAVELPGCGGAAAHGAPAPTRTLLRQGSDRRRAQRPPGVSRRALRQGSCRMPPAARADRECARAGRSSTCRWHARADADRRVGLGHRAVPGKPQQHFEVVGAGSSRGRAGALLDGRPDQHRAIAWAEPERAKTPAQEGGIVDELPGRRRPASARPGTRRCWSPDQTPGPLWDWPRARRRAAERAGAQQVVGAEDHQ